MAESLFPSAIVCSCGRRFESSWSADFDEKTPANRQPTSAAWLFVRHHAARLASRFSTTTKVSHRAAAIFVRCLFCSESVDINDYRYHLADGMCSDNAIVSDAIKHYAEHDDAATSPVFKCDLCEDVSAGPVLRLHSHPPSSIVGYNRAKRYLSTLDMSLSCGECRSHVPLADAVGHAAYWHPERIRCESPSAIANLYITAPPSYRPPPPIISGEMLATFDIDIALEEPPAADVDDAFPTRAAILFECDLCGSTFPTAESRQCHAALHAPPRPFRCAVCSNYFKSKKSLAHHSRQHGALDAVQCPDCGKTLSSKRALQSHRSAVHEKLRPYACRHCGKTFGFKAACMTHENMHTHSRTFDCPYCPETFLYYTTYLNHVRRVHEKNMPTAVLTCDECPGERTYASAQSLSKHKRMVHNDERPYQCAEPGCVKAYKSSTGLKKHYRSAAHGRNSSRSAYQISNPLRV